MAAARFLNRSLFAQPPPASPPNTHTHTLKKKKIIITLRAHTHAHAHKHARVYVPKRAIAFTVKQMPGNLVEVGWVEGAGGEGGAFYGNPQQVAYFAAAIAAKIIAAGEVGGVIKKIAS